jgi:lipopolysaccharide export system permease protein
MLNKIDKYIIKVFLTTFLATIGLFSIIIIVFDLGEKLDDFMGNKVPVKAILLEYYINFIPNIMNMFSPIFIFISVIFFTSRLAQRSEIIAILASGVSYVRLLRPYIITAIILAIFSFLLTAWIIPISDKKRVDFENNYTRNNYNYKESIHRQIKPGVFMSLGWFSQYDSTGTNLTIEKYDSKEKLESKLYARRISYNKVLKKWNLRDVFIRDYLKDGSHHFKQVYELDTSLQFNPSDFFRRPEDLQSYGLFELNKIIDSERERGSETVHLFLTEKYKRVAGPLSTIILALIGVFVSSKKSRGGIGVNLGIGIVISFSFLFVVQLFNSYAAAGILPAYISVFIPIIIYGLIGLLLYQRVQK